MDLYLHLMVQSCLPSLQRKNVSNSAGLVDFATGLVIFVLNSLDWQVLFFKEIQITEAL